MRMRPKKNRDARLEKVSGLLAELDGGRVKLSPAFGEGRELFVELGCGKGAFITGLSERFPDASLLAVEKVTDVAMMAMEKADRAGCANVRFLIADGAAIDMLLPAHSVARLYLNFSDPWPKKRNAKRRLTSPLFLERYKTILAPAAGSFSRPTTVRCSIIRWRPSPQAAIRSRTSALTCMAARWPRRTL